MEKAPRQAPARETVQFKAHISPERQQDIVQQAREKVKAFGKEYPQVGLSKERLEKDAKLLRPDIFAQPSQAINSLHDISHNALFSVFGQYVAEVLTAQTGQSINEKVLELGMYHDTQRMRDLIESAPYAIRQHGIKAAEKLAELSQDMDVSDADRAEAAAIMRVHDNAFLPKEFADNPTARLFLAVDRILLNRVEYQKPRKITEKIIRGLSYPFVKMRLERQLQTKRFNMRQFKDIADALFLMSTTEINNQVAQGIEQPNQFQAVIHAAEKLGMVKAPVPTSAPVLSAVA